MATFAFSIPTQIQFGAGAALQAGSTAQELLGSARAAREAVLVVIDPGVTNAAWLGGILGSLSESGLKYECFEEVKPNPRDEDAYKAAALIKEKGYGVVLAIGGGSAMDAAKTAALVAVHGGKASDYAGWGKVPGSVLPVIAIPTTAGSGSEVTSWAVITDSSTHAKLAIGDRKLAPAAALVDPTLMVSLPAGLTATTGMDALTHAIEAYIGGLSSPLNDALALEAIRLVARNLKKAVEDGSDLAAREGMALASTLGGIAINNADVAGVHCMSEALGGMYDAPHGLLNAILLPYFMEFWEAGCAERFAHIAEAFGAAPEPQEAVACVSRLSRSLDLPSLASTGVKQDDLPKLAALAEANVSNPSNPMPMGAEQYLAILTQAMAD
jgi:alcohol dehydrogenase